MSGTDPIHQFNITKYFTFATVGGNGTQGSGVDISFTNSALFMFLAVAVVSGYLIFSTRAGTEGMRFFPFIFTLFSFILLVNLFGIFPYFFTVTSHLIVPAALAILVMVIVIGYGFMRNGLKFLKMFVPSGIPAPILVIVVPMEIISFLSRPLSLSLRGLPAARHDRRADRARIAGGGAAGLRFHHSDLRLSQRRHPPRTLIDKIAVHTL